MPTAAIEMLAPGETLERRAFGSDVDAEWVLRVTGTEGPDKRFRPMRDLEFRPSWEG